MVQSIKAQISSKYFATIFDQFKKKLNPFFGSIFESFIFFGAFFFEKGFITMVQIFENVKKIMVQFG